LAQKLKELMQNWGSEEEDTSPDDNDDVIHL
jgi:hypothetical protein